MIVRSRRIRVTGRIFHEIVEGDREAVHERLIEKPEEINTTLPRVSRGGLRYRDCRAAGWAATKRSTIWQPDNRRRATRGRRATGLQTAFLRADIAPAALGLATAAEAIATAAGATAATVVAALTAAIAAAETARLAAAESRSATRAGTIFRFVHAELASAEVMAVKARDGVFRGALVIERDKRKPARTSGLALGRKVHVADRAGLREERFQLLAARIEGEVTDKNFGSH